MILLIWLLSVQKHPIILRINIFSNQKLQKNSFSAHPNSLIYLFYLNIAASKIIESSNPLFMFLKHLLYFCSHFNPFIWNSLAIKLLVLLTTHALIFIINCNYRWSQYILNKISIVQTINKILLLIKLYRLLSLSSRRACWLLTLRSNNDISILKE